MKKLLVVVPSFQHGGTNRSFCNMIDLFDFRAHDMQIDLLAVKDLPDKPYMDEFLSRGITILPQNKGFSAVYYGGNNFVRKAIRKMLSFCSTGLVRRILKLSARKYDGKYDLVVSMEEGISSRVASYIDAPRRIFWVRCMYDRYFDLTHNENESEVYGKADRIVCVSQECRKAFVQIYPQFGERTVCIPNTQNREAILEKSAESPAVILDKDAYTVVSVGRLDEVKQFHLIPPVVKALADKGISLKWYIIGEGHYRKPIEEAIVEHQVSEQVLLVGAQTNPYPIMKQADLIAITSLSESFCNVITEGKILNRAILSTAFPAVYDTMGDYAAGVICPFDVFAAKLEEMIAFPVKPAETPVAHNCEDPDVIAFVRRLEDIF